MQLFPFTPIGSNQAISGTTSSVAQAMRTAPTPDMQVVRIVNPSPGSVAFVDLNGGTATVATGSPVLPGSERVFMMDPGATDISVILDTGTATIYAQLGKGA